MAQPKPQVGELYFVDSEETLKKSLILPENRPAALGQVFLCVKHWEKHDTYEYHRVIMRDERFYVLSNVELASDLPLGQPLGHLKHKNVPDERRAGVPHQVADLYAALTAMLFKTCTEAFLRGLEPGEVLVLHSDDNGTPFPAGGVYVYDNREGTLTLGRRLEGKLVKKRVKAKAIKDVSLASVVGAPAPAGEPRLLMAGDFVKVESFFERWPLFASDCGPMRTSSPFIFIERQTRGELRRKFHIAMQDTYGEVVKGISEDVDVLHWLC